MDNHIPESIGITSRDLAGFGIFWILSVGLLIIPPYKTRWLLMVKVSTDLNDESRLR